MKPAQRLARLEGRLPRDNRPWHERLFSFRVAGRGRSGLAMLWLTRLTLAIDDQRATDAERAAWRAQLQSSVQALEHELDRLQSRQEPLPDLSVIRGLGVLSPKWQREES